MLTFGCLHIFRSSLLFPSIFPTSVVLLASNFHGTGIFVKILSVVMVLPFIRYRSLSFSTTISLRSVDESRVSSFLEYYILSFNIKRQPKFYNKFVKLVWHLLCKPASDLHWKELLHALTWLVIILSIFNKFIPNCLN